MFTRLEVPVQDLARAVQNYEGTVLAEFERYDGLASIILLVDRASGVLENIVWFDSLGVLRGSAICHQEMRALFVADVPTAKYGEIVELDLVIAEVQGVF